MENLEDNYKNEDEISLLDLLSVFVKYRKLIIWGTVVFALLVSIFLFFLSKSSDNQDQLYLIDYNINIYPNMDIFKSIVSFYIIDDIYATGNTVRVIKETVENLGGNILGVGVVINIKELNNDEVFSLIDINEE